VEYVQIAHITDLEINSMIKVQAGKKEILLVNVADTYYALNNRCPHMGGSLADGQLAGTVVTCPRHGTQIDVRNGSIVQDARLLFIKMKVSDAVCYPVRIEGDLILVGLE
jgi:3-phenylpropionate/trans-cinnamate dioxygenase ferredoxin subunit